MNVWTKCLLSFSFLVLMAACAQPRNQNAAPAAVNAAAAPDKSNAGAPTASQAGLPTSTGDAATADTVAEPSQKPPYLTGDDVFRVFSDQALSLPRAAAASVASKVHGAFAGGPLNIREIFYASAFKPKIINDTGKIYPRMIIKDPKSGNLMDVESPFYIAMNSKGLMPGISYDFMYFFVRGDTDLETLDSYEFGQGPSFNHAGDNIEVSASVHRGWEASFLFFDMGWMSSGVPGPRAPKVLVATLKLGVSLGISFPRMKFVRITKSPSVAVDPEALP